MNLQVCLFSDSNLTATLNRDIVKLKSNSCKLQNFPQESLVTALQCAGFSEESYSYALKTPVRNYQTHFGIDKDSHFAIEYLGLSAATRTFIYTIDLTDHLDFILACKTKCSLNSFNYKDRFDEFSRAVLTLNPNLLADYDLNYLIGMSRELDLYLLDLLSVSKVEQECLVTLLTGFNLAARDTVAYIGFYLQHEIPDLIVKSIYGSKVVCCSHSPHPELNSLLLETPSGDVREIPVECVNRKEWLNEILK